MRIYVIDTARMEAWKAAYPEAILTCSNPPPLFHFEGCDFVFAHAHEEPVDHNADLVLSVLSANSPEVTLVCRALTESALGGTVPTIVLYSGDAIPRRKAEFWRETAVREQGPLAGYPPGRIVALSDPVSRTVNGEYLKEVIRGCISRICARAPETEGSTMADSATVPGGTVAASISVAVTLVRNEEALLAARLLVEAKCLCGGHANAMLSGIALHAPSQELCVLAEALLETSSGDEAFDKRVNALIAALSAGSAQQP